MFPDIKFEFEKKRNSLIETFSCSKKRELLYIPIRKKFIEFHLDTTQTTRAQKLLKRSEKL